MTKPNIEVVGAAPLTRRTIWQARMLDHRNDFEIMVTFGMDVDEDVPGLIRLFPVRVCMQIVDQSPPDARLDMAATPSLSIEKWVNTAFRFTKKKVAARTDYFDLWSTRPATLRVRLESPKAAA